MHGYGLHAAVLFLLDKAVQILSGDLFKVGLTVFGDIEQEMLNGYKARPDGAEPTVTPILIPKIAFGLASAWILLGPKPL
jgi:hypothetical protein